jgi:predicted XRE-type DNA-binding protein
MTDKMLKELHDIRMLLMLLLYKFGATQTEIAIALDIKQASVSEMMASSSVKAATMEIKQKL